jgi:hypothetical protein
MSRSYREPWYTDGYKGSSRKQWSKRYANKVVRHAVDVPNGKAYRKYYDPWNICDYRWYASFEPYVSWWTKTGEPEWVYPGDADRPWRVCRK